MINIYLDKSKGSDYLYKQIYNHLKQSILEKKLSFGDKLPPKRRLSAQLNISVNSVTNAYNQLYAEGYIYSIEKRGYFVEDIAFLDNNIKKSNIPKHLKEDLTPKDDWLTLSHIKSNNSKFPFLQWIKYQQKAIREHGTELADISHPQGPYVVRKKVASMIALTRGVKCEPEQIVFGSSTQTLVTQLSIIAMNLSATKVAVENPGYPRIFKLLKNLNMNIIPLDIDNQGVVIDEVKEADPNFLFITPSHQFPTGTIMPISRRIQLLNWVTNIDENHYIVEDDYDSEFIYNSDNIPSLYSLSDNEKVIYLGSFSKTLLPSFRISYMVLPPILLEKYKHFFSDWTQECNLLQLYTLYHFIESGEYQKHIKRMSKYYNYKRVRMINALSSFFKEKVFIHDIPAGLHFLATFHTDKTYKTVKQKAKEEKLEIYTLEHYLISKSKDFEKGKIQLIIGFSSIKEDVIPQTLERLYNVLYK